MKIFILLLIFFQHTVFAAETVDATIGLDFDKKSCQDSEGGFLYMDSNYKDTNTYIDENFGTECKIKGIYLDGNITKNTLPKLKLAFKLLSSRKFFYITPEYKNIDSNRLSINSGGGLIMEAIKIGNFIADKNVAIMVSVPSKCYSACVFIYAAAKVRYAAGKIGVHRPFAKDISTDNLSYYEYLDKYKSLTPKFNQYFSKFGVSKNLVDLMNSISSEDMKILTYDEREMYGLNQNIAAQEYERARTIQLCGQEYYDLSLKQQALTMKCTEIHYPDTSAIVECDFKAWDITPDYRDRYTQCLDKKYERIK
jgi:ATP-dependent protease ClpP protease subunit